MLRLRHAVLVAAVACRAATQGPERVVPNDNRVAAGTLAHDTLTVHLEAREGRWHPDGDDGPSLKVQIFAERGRPAQNPGPMIRVPAGTTIRLSLHSALRDSTLVVYGLQTRPSALGDTIQVPPQGTRELLFAAGTPGTYFYWATTTHQPVGDRAGIDAQLHGAFIVDPPGAAPPADRVFVLGSWTGPRDKAAGYSPELRVINGVSWPLTERLTYTAGDTVRWRWVNPTDSPHPMHLHGFYFDITHRGDWASDSALAPDGLPHVVTEMPLAGGTFAMQWVPDEPGNWLMHCHVAFHTSLYLSAHLVADPADPIVVDHMRGMRGMVLAVVVRPGQSTARRATGVAGARDIRLVAQAAPKRFHGLDEMAFVRQDGDRPPAPDSVPTPSSLLVLRRNEPVRITIVNHLRATTGVHWHGIEVPAYSDGVPGWSGAAPHIAPAIAPGDSFVAAFTPTRSGTFIYHAHSNETFQINLGLYGALLVVDSARYDPLRERLIILGGDGPGGRGARINGRVVPDTLRLTAGTTYRLRLIDIIPDWTIRLALTRDERVVAWRALAKDGAELPPRQQVVQPAAMVTGPGQTMDFEYRPTEPGLLRLDVQQRTGAWKTSLPIRVHAAP